MYSVWKFLYVFGVVVMLSVILMCLIGWVLMVMFKNMIGLFMWWCVCEDDVVDLLVFLFFVCWYVYVFMLKYCCCLMICVCWLVLCFCFGCEFYIFFVVFLIWFFLLCIVFWLFRSFDVDLLCLILLSGLFFLLFVWWVCCLLSESIVDWGLGFWCFWVCWCVCVGLLWVC